MVVLEKQGEVMEDFLFFLACLALAWVTFEPGRNVGGAEVEHEGWGG